jgi:hypothetical protein
MFMVTNSKPPAGAPPSGEPGLQMNRKTATPARDSDNPSHARHYALGAATGTHRVLLAATCGALILAAIGDEATGYDGPGPFIYLAFAGIVALVPGRYTPLPRWRWPSSFVWRSVAVVFRRPAI